ncbi:GNAT family N-acetyltransferase, partial [Streptomyces albipurpureus]
LRPNEWEHLCDPGRGTTLITRPIHEPGRFIALSHLMRTEATSVREMGLLVEDEWQARGLGTALTRSIVDLARTHTLDCEVVTVMTGSDNRRMLSILSRMGAEVPNVRSATVEATIRVRR